MKLLLADHSLIKKLPVYSRRKFEEEKFYTAIRLMPLFTFLLRLSYDASEKRHYIFSSREIFKTYPRIRKQLKSIGSRTNVS
jgi:hypothetical protein